MADINIYGTFKSQTGDGKIAYASEIYDVAKGKFQSEINQEGGSSAAYETIDIGTQTDFHGTPPDGYYTISYNGNLYNDIDAIWSSGKIPVLKMALSAHTSAYSIPLYKAPDNDFDGHDRAENGDYTVDVSISSSQQRINTRSVGTYIKPSGGIPKTDLAQAVQETLDKAENLDAELSESSTNAVQNKVIAKELNDNYAKKDGFYESMGVGTAVNLAGQELRNNDSLYRTSGGTEDIATGTARIEVIKGQTIAWNQCLKDGNFAQGDLTYWATLRATATISNNIITVTKSESSRSGYIYKTNVSGDKGCGIISGHAYLLCGFVNSESPVIRVVAGSANAEFEGTGTWFNFKYILKPNSASGVSFAFLDNSNDGIYTTQWKELQVYDLTLIYGAGNEPSTPEQFEADYFRWFGKPLTYEPYDAGSLRNVMLDGLKTIGFNQYNPTTGTAKLIGGNQYQITGTYTSLTLNDETITPDSNGKFTPTISGTLTVTGGSTDTCVHLVWSGTKDGIYEPYEENTISIPTTTMTGKLNGQGSSVIIFPDGMKGVNDVHDELYYVGGKTYAVKRVGRVDLGSLTWILNNRGFFVAGLPDSKDGTNMYVKQKCVCSKYPTETPFTIYNLTYGISTGSQGVSLKCAIVYDSSYSDAAIFKAAMSGVYLDYELETPLVYEVDDFTLPARYKVNDWGTEEQLQASGANGIAAIISCLYGVNAVDILRNLPKNYISTESMDNFLAALGAAMGGTWTKTWNDNDGEYNFSFTANALTNSLTSNQEDI